MGNLNKQVTRKQLLLLMLLAYAFSFAIRLIWVWQFHSTPSFMFDGQLMINTNDGYTWAAGAQNILYDLHGENAGIRSMWSYGVVFFTVLFVKITPFSLETIILYMPTVISSLVVIPIILISRLYGQTLWGFFAALLGSIAWSYYNRTMTGYYDTDMFSAMAPMFILYFLMKSTIDFNLRSALYAALAISVYPFLYDAGRAVVYAMGIIYALYMMFYHRGENRTYLSMILVFVALVPFPLVAPFNYITKMALLIVLYFVLKKSTVEQKKLMITSGVLFILFMYFGNVFDLILRKTMSYLATGTDVAQGLNFYSVTQTVREAGQISFETFANRISGSQIGVVLAFIGYIVLVFRYRAFILALPLMGIGAFALFGGLRFTVYAVPVAAMSAVFLFFVIGDYFKDKKFKYLFVTLATGAMLYPNIIHVIGYKVPTVFMNEEVKILKKLDSISSEKDYTLTWWDYGYPIWFYSDTNTIIDGGKHRNDNFIISKILNTSSQTQAANFSRLAVETYVKSNYKIIADTLFKDKNPNDLLEALESDEFKLPEKTRDIYLYLPNRMLNIFPTVGLFSNIDLKTGIKGKQPFFYKADRFKDDGKSINFGSGIILDKQTSILHLGSQTTPIKRFVIAGYDQDQKLQKKVQSLNPNADISIIFMQSYNAFLIVDEKMYNSLFIKMFVLEEFDKNLFEPVIMSPYAKVYKLKI